MSHNIKIVQETFSAIYNFDVKYFNSHQSFDYLFADHEAFKIGELNAYNIPTPGHTPACLSYVVGDDAVFVGDTLFMPDYGTARCDFPKGSAEVLFDSVQKIYQLAPEMRVFLCHAKYCCESSVHAQKQQNIHIHVGTKKEDFVTMRTQRDANLAMPKLILPAIQINIDAGKFPKPEGNGIRYLKIPFNHFKSAN